MRLSDCLFSPFFLTLCLPVFLSYLSSSAWTLTSTTSMWTSSRQDPTGTPLIEESAPLANNTLLTSAEYKVSSMSTDKCSTHVFRKSYWKVAWCGEKWMQTAQRGPTTGKDMRKNVLKGTANWQTKTSINCVRSPHFVSMITSSNRKSWRQWEKCHKFALKSSWKCLLSDAHRQTWRSVVCKQTGIGKLYSRQATDSVDCEGILQCLLSWSTVRLQLLSENPSSGQIFINRSGCWSFSTRSLYFWNRFSCARVSVKGVGVFITLAKQWVRLSCQYKSLRSYLAGFTLLTQIWDCSVDTELINRNNRAKKVTFVSPSAQKCVDNFSTSFAFKRSSGQWTRGTGRNWGVRFLRIWSSSIQRLCPILLVVVEYDFFSDPGPRNDHYPGWNLLA